MKTTKRRIIIPLLALPALCLIAAALAALSNLVAPNRSASVERLSPQEKARIAEALHLRRSLGDQVWPGWGGADIPVIVYNEAYAYLIGAENPADGWATVPALAHQGGPWEPVPADDFYGQPYYRQVLPAGVIPQNFTVRVGERWAASFMTQEWATISLSRQVRGDFGPLFPHWWFARLMLGGSDGYIAGLAHEAFHAFVGSVAGDRLAAAENAGRRWESSYPWEDKALQAAWQAELNLLQAGLKADTDAAAADLARQFLAQRSTRRQSAGLNASLVGYERWREWEEGLAKYAELALWQAGQRAAGYQPVAEILADPDFDRYAGFSRRWQSELSTLTKRAGDRGDGRFYYTGMAQAFLLDRLAPGWQARGLAEGVWLEDLLAEATASSR